MCGLALLAKWQGYQFAGKMLLTVWDLPSAAKWPLHIYTNITIEAAMWRAVSYSESSFKEWWWCQNVSIQVVFQLNLLYSGLWNKLVCAFQQNLHKISAMSCPFQSEIKRFATREHGSRSIRMLSCFPNPDCIYTVNSRSRFTSVLQIALIQINPDPKWSPKSRLLLHSKFQI